MRNIIDSRITPISPTFSSCLECRVELRIYPGALHPEKVTDLVGVNPTQVNVPGTKITNSIGRTREVKLSGWFLSSENKVDSKDLREHIDWILDQLKNSSDALKELQNTEGVKMRLMCVWWSKSGHQGPTLWPEQMKALADLNLECSFDVYFESAFGDES